MSFATESGPENVVTIKVVGVGGAGNNVVNRMVKSGTQGIEYVAVNTDKQALAVSSADQKIQIGEKLTHGQGAGSDPDVGKRSAEESRNNIAKSLENADMVFITAGMGGGTGTGAAPTIADIAREAGILTVGVVTKPFKFEGANRMRQAEQGIADLKGKVDSLIIIPNDRLKYVTDQKITFANAFGIADDVLKQAVTSISELVGFSKNVIILTRNKGYRKEEKDFYLPGFIYNKYPAIREQLRLRYRQYNEVLDYIDQLEAEGKAFVIRPQSPIKVGRTGSDTKKLEELYEEGYECGKQITQL